MQEVFTLECHDNPYCQDSERDDRDDVVSYRPFGIGNDLPDVHAEYAL